MNYGIKTQENRYYKTEELHNTKLSQKIHDTIQKSTT